MIINDLVPAVIDKLRGRTDKASSCPYYIAMALIDLSQNYEFEELKQQGPLTNFVQGQQQYPLNSNPFIIAPEDKITFLRNWFVYFDTNGVVVPGQSTGSEIKARDIRVVEPMSKILGLPTLACISGSYDNNGFILVGFMPDNPYPTQLTYQREHPFNCSYEQVLQSIGNPAFTAQVASTKIRMPRDWSEIIVLAAAEKACYSIGMNDIGMSYHQQLYGYKDKRGSEMPGIITVRLTQQERQSSFNERQMRPVVRRYCR